MHADWRPAYSHKYAILAIVLGGVLMSVLDGIVVSIALPTVTASFAVDLASSQWTITAYLVTLTGLLLFFGKLADYTGKSLLFIVGLTVFTLSSLACGLSATLAQLVAFRVAQGVGGAMVFSISGAILFLAFPQDERGRAMGYLGSTVAVGSILGPILGGFLVDTLGWRYIFLINLPIGAILAACALFFLRIPEEKSRFFRMDWPGGAALVASLVSLMMFLSRISDPSIPLFFTAPLGALFLIATAAFLLRESRCAQPLLDLGIFHTRGFLFPVLAMMLFFIANFMVNIVGPFFLQGVMGLRPTQVGLLFLVVPLVMVVASPLARWLYDKRYRRYYGMLGMAVVAVSYFALGFITRGMYGVAALAGIFVLLGLGSALFQSPNSTEVMNSLPRSQTSIASSVSSAARNLAMTLGVAFASVLLPLQLRLAGYTGEVLGAEKGLLAKAIGNVMIGSGVLCLLTTFILLNNRAARRADPTESSGAARDWGAS
jgi:EmrB/QacA subfamily drug resistance transporter